MKKPDFTVTVMFHEYCLGLYRVHVGKKNIHVLASQSVVTDAPELLTLLLLLSLQQATEDEVVKAKVQELIDRENLKLGSELEDEKFNERLKQASKFADLLGDGDIPF